MSIQTTPAAKNNGQPSPAKHFQLPPEERFWKRHSPNHEFPLSTVLALALFTAAMAFLVLKVQFNWFADPEPPSTGAIAISEGPEGEGGDNGQGGQGGDGRPIKGPPGKEENLSNSDDRFKNDPTPPTPLDQMPHPMVSQEDLPDVPQDFISDPTVAISAFADINKEAQKALTRALPKGPSSSSSDGGTGTQGRPGKKGRPGTATRADRVYRWHIVLDTRSGANYLQQLRFLKAFVGKPEKVGAASMLQYRVFRNLDKTPVRGQLEDPATLDRFYAIDTKPESVRALADAIGLPEQPPHLVIFLPRTLEDELARKELAYRGRAETQIAETQFRVLWRGRTYEVQVTDQRVK